MAQRVGNFEATIDLAGGDAPEKLIDPDFVSCYSAKCRVGCLLVKRKTAERNRCAFRREVLSARPTRFIAGRFANRRSHGLNSIVHPNRCGI